MLLALIMFIIDLAGVILLSAFELLTGGQTMARVPAEMGTAVIWGVIGLTLVNLAAAYFYHLAEPQTWKGIEFGVLTDRLQKEALQQAQMNVETEAQQLGAILAARATAELKYNLRLPMSDFETCRAYPQRYPGKQADRRRPGNPPGSPARPWAVVEAKQEAAAYPRPGGYGSRCSRDLSPGCATGQANFRRLQKDVPTRHSFQRWHEFPDWLDVPQLQYR